MKFSEGLKSAGLSVRKGEKIEEELARLRNMYEPYVRSLASHLRLSIPPWVAREVPTDNWQTSAWEKRLGSGKEGDGSGKGEGWHF